MPTCNTCPIFHECPINITGGKRRSIRKIKAGDLLIVSPWDIQDEKADIQFKYKQNQAKLLSRRRVLHEKINILKS